MKLFRNNRNFSVEDLIKYPVCIQFFESFLGSIFISTYSIIDYLLIAKFRLQNNKIFPTDFKEIDIFLKRRKLMLGIRTSICLNENKTIMWSLGLLALLEFNQTFVREFLTIPSYYAAEAKKGFINQRN